ncbi:molybdopterin-guanine dinucleotide biosynthesis protein MobB [Methanoculleus taiwanensis]|uniref:Molybdopterin-guanine dinucleotide biosynthesis protein MobB n=1 Tax=Methanoculleus taiwanensis TaxID=1550565 RepID=A0A498H1J6_9EURY|nr:molybdopterin-guanine dinucleotide biosynthesis protein B [Methanoculleus taiwanensis]RXE55900.1 molybdopterin-guanine dinucleotide biosynthesis protein MobB [Methanoculleus taiwanensis]
MKIIHIVGLSNTGKTYFARELIGRLKDQGSVGAVKHLGHHPFALEEGKDTTEYYESGAAISCGVDEEKAVMVTREADLEQVLKTLCDAGVEYAIVEGFKSRQFPKIVMGDLAAENVILRNPTVDEVVSSLDRFEDYFTIEGLVRELRRECDTTRAGAILTFNGLVREWTDGERTEYMDFDDSVDEKLKSIRAEMEAIDGIIGVRFHHRKGRLYAGEDITYLAILAERRHEAFAAVIAAIDRLKREVHNPEETDTA